MRRCWEWSRRILSEPDVGNQDRSASGCIRELPEVAWEGAPEGWDWRRRNALADAARECEWDKVLALVTQHPELVNGWRPDGKSLFTPLHQAAHAGAFHHVINRLVELGAWRTVQNARGERPVDVAVRKGHNHLKEALTPVLRRTVPFGVLMKIQDHLHDLMRSRIEGEGGSTASRLPELQPLLEMQHPIMWFLSGIAEPYSMYGRFRVELEADGLGAVLMVQSWDGQVHEVTSAGVRMVQRGYR